MKLIGKMAAGAALLLAFSAPGSAQVRTVGPAAPYLVTGRSVSVPPYHLPDQQSTDKSDRQESTRRGSDASSAAPPSDRTEAH
jgi:hypothetical protein